MRFRVTGRAGRRGEGIVEAGVHRDVPDWKHGVRRISTPCFQSTQSSEIFYSHSSQISPPTQLKPLGFLEKIEAVRVIVVMESYVLGWLNC